MYAETFVISFPTWHNVVSDHRLNTTIHRASRPRSSCQCAPSSSTIHVGHDELLRFDEPRARAKDDLWSLLNT